MHSTSPVGATAVYAVRDEHQSDDEHEASKGNYEGMWAFISSSSSAAIFAFETCVQVSTRNNWAKRRAAYPEVVVRRCAVLEDAEADVPRVLCQEAFHALEQRGIEKDGVDGLLAHDFQIQSDDGEKFELKEK